MAVTAAAFRHALRCFPSGVTVVTIRAGEVIHGLTVSAFASVSPDPPLVMVVIDHRHAAYPLLERDDATFAVNILGQNQEAVSERFAWHDAAERFSTSGWTTAATGAPVLTDALAWLDCTVHGRLAAGTHTIYVGEVQACGVPRAGEAPLVYWDRAYRSINRGGADPEPR